MAGFAIVTGSGSAHILFRGDWRWPEDLIVGAVDEPANADVAEVPPEEVEKFDRALGAGEIEIEPSADGEALQQGEGASLVNEGAVLKNTFPKAVAVEQDALPAEKLVDVVQATPPVAVRTTTVAEAAGESIPGGGGLAA